jgi:CHAT domain-containing protein
LPAPTAGGAKTGAAQPLVVKHEIVNLPSASTLAVLRREARERQPAPKAVAVLADPVFESTDERMRKRDALTARDGDGASPNADEGRSLGLVVAKTAKESGVTGDTLRIPRLPGTRREAEQIVKLVPAAQRKQAFDFAASRQTATDPELSQYRYVHFATHGFLNSQHPELSGLMFTMFDEEGRAQDGFLRAHEVFNLKLSAEVVVLSACQTGLGKEVRGEGLVGLTRGFMYAGAPRVVVSLWSVSDAATAELMTRFYRGMLKDGMRPARALQAAQVSMLKDKKYASPFYWAAFTLQGEWR